MRDLIAIGLAVALAGVGIFSAFTYYARVSDTQAAQALLENVQEMGARMGARAKNRQGGHGTGTVADQNIIAFAMAPPGMAIDGNDLKTDWDGDITVTGHTNFIHIKVDEVPGNACRYILSRLERRSGITAVIAEADHGTDTDFDTAANDHTMHVVPGVSDRVNSTHGAGAGNDLVDADITTGCGIDDSDRIIWFRTGW